jgi:uncharacterized delta-60 repeat protein
LSERFVLDSGLDGPVLALGLQGEKILVGGRFHHVNGVGINSLARLNPDGSLDESFGIGLSLVDRIYDIFVLPDEKILIGGKFKTVQGIDVVNFARLHPDGTLDDSFSKIPDINNSVFSISVHWDGRIVIAGRFTSTIHGFQADGIARLLPNGMRDAAFLPAPGTNGDVLDLQILPNGKILMAGKFTEVNGVPRRNVAVLNQDGGVDAEFDPGSGANDCISGFVQQNNGWVVLGGFFTRINDQDRHYVARLRNEAGTSFRNTRIDQGEFQVTFHGLVGARYDVESSTDLNDWKPEMTLESVAAAQDISLPWEASKARLFLKVLPK